MEGKESTEKLWISCTRRAANGRAHHQTLHRKASHIPRKRTREKGRGVEEATIVVHLCTYPLYRDQSLDGCDAHRLPLIDDRPRTPENT